MRFTVAVASTLALLLASPAAAAPARKAAPAPAAASSGPVFDLAKLSLAGYIGGEFGDLDGVYLRADASMPFLTFGPEIDLIGVVQLGYTHLGADIPYGSISWNMIRMVAAARAQWSPADRFDVFGDAGLGFYFGGWKSEADIPFFGTVENDDTTGGATMRFAVGAHYELAPQMKLAAEMGFNPYFGDADTTNFFIGAGFEYKL